MLCGVCQPQVWFDWPRNYAGKVETLGVALKETRPGYRHTGLVIYDRAKKAHRFLHLADHYSFRNEQLSPEYFIYPNETFSLGEIEYLAERAQKLWETNGPKIAYGLDYDGKNVFDDQMKFLGADGMGLTCATFVLAFFAKCGFPLADVTSWLPRANDAFFQQAIFDYLKPRLDEDQLARAEKSVGTAPRFRPEEVTACFVNYNIGPTLFAEAQLWGLAVLKEAKMTAV